MEKHSAFEKFAPTILQVYHSILARLVDVTEARVETFFHKTLKLQHGSFS